MFQEGEIFVKPLARDELARLTLPQIILDLRERCERVAEELNDLTGFEAYESLADVSAYAASRFG